MKSDLSLIILYSPKFTRQYKKLTVDIQELAEAREIMFRQDPFDPRLKTHKLHGIFQEFWSFYINYQYRIIFDFLDQKTVRFHSIGNHDIYQ